jgi:hypothetical protein
MKFPDYEIHHELPNSLRAHINKPCGIPTGVTQSDRPGNQLAYKSYSDNDLDMTVPLVSGTNGTDITLSDLFAMV